MPKTYAYFQRMNDRIPCSFALLKRKQNVCSSTAGKKFPLIKVNKQTLFWKFKTQTSPVLGKIKFRASAHQQFINQLAPRNVAQAPKKFS